MTSPIKEIAHRVMSGFNSVPPLKNKDAEADAQRVARILIDEGNAAAIKALNQLILKNNMVRWEALAFKDRVRDIASELRDTKATTLGRHGWVTPLPGGVRAKCGGPDSPLGCRVCAAEKKAKEQAWTDNVETTWSPPEGFFKQTPDAIAKGLKKAHKNKSGAMGSLNFYINRAGKNLDRAAKDRLEMAKDKLESLYPKEAQ